MRTKKNIIFLGLVLGIFSLSCSKMNDLHLKYLLEGERVYVGQPDSVHILAGMNRVILQYWISDPKAKKMKVFWDNNLDSILIEIPNSGVEAKTLEICDLEPKIYNFQIITFNDNWENPSIPMEVIAEVYSENYLSKLFPRRIEYANYLTPDSVFISFYSPTDKSIHSVIYYTNSDGSFIEKIISNDTSFVILENFKENLEFSTFFLPYIGALDTLHTIPEVFTDIDVLLDKSNFRRWNPDGIPYQDIDAAYSIEKIWDNNYKNFFISGFGSGQTLPIPYDFTFDMGQEKNIKRFKQWQRMTTSMLYGQQQIKRFQLWGSVTQDVSAELSDWFLLGTFEVKKPANDADKVFFAEAGDNFIFVGKPTVRYIRYRVLELFSNNGAMALGEIEFYSTD